MTAQEKQQDGHAIRACAHFVRASSDTLPESETRRRLVRLSADLARAGYSRAPHRLSLAGKKVGGRPRAVPKEPHRVRELRLASSMTQKAVAMRLGIEPIQVRRWERGCPLPPEYLAPLARLFGVKEAFLLGDETGQPGAA